MREATPPLTQNVFMELCLVKHRDNFTLLLNKYCFLINTRNRNTQQQNINYFN